MPLKQMKEKYRMPSLHHAVSYRIPLPVTEVVLFRSGDSYTVCPRCDSLLDGEYMRYCDCCGQCLAWELLDYAKVSYAPGKKSWNGSVSAYAAQRDHLDRRN